MDWRLAVLPLVLSGCLFSFDSDKDGLRNGVEKDLLLDPDNPDTDNDGLSDGEEVNDYETDPLDADSDDDGLLDGEEIAAGTDPFAEDTDGDGYSDFAEVDAGTDPNDIDDVIYVGGWPYNPNKYDIEEGPVGTPLVVGDQFPPHTGRDQFGDRVALYDFGGQGVLTIIDASATWCGPCQAVASWLAGGTDPYDLETTHGRVRRQLNRGGVQWVTILSDGSNGAATQSEVEDWDASFPNEYIPVLRDNNQDMIQSVNNRGDGIFWPTYVVVDENMTVVARGGTSDVLDYVLGEL